MPYASTADKQTSDLSERLVELSSRLDAKLRELQDHVRQDAHHRRPNDGNGTPARVRETLTPNAALAEARGRRRAILHQKIESAVRRGAFWEALKCEAALDAELLTNEIEHDLDLLISEAAHPEPHDALGQPERGGKAVRRDN